MYPNPASEGYVFVAFSENSESEVKLILRNEIGQLVLNQSLTPRSKSGRTAYYNSEIELVQTAGVYFVEVRTSNGAIHRSKLVIR